MNLLIPDPFHAHVSCDEAIPTGIDCRWFPGIQVKMSIDTDFLPQRVSGLCIAIGDAKVPKNYFTSLSTKAVTSLTTLGKEKAKQ
jgi:hypothetical protein